MRQCQTCGSDNSTAARFCQSCGTRLDAPSPAVRKVVTALFCDLVSSTSLGEALDPELYREVLARYFTTMREVIDHHHGRVEKFIGDAVTATFGLPLLHEDDAVRAVLCGLAMQRSIARLSEDITESARFSPQVRIGINTGEVVVSGDEEGEFVVLGDVMNVAARLQEMARPGDVLVSEATYKLTKHAVEVESWGRTTLEGKSTQTAVFQVRSAVPDAVGIARRVDLPHLGRASQVEQILGVVERAGSRRECQAVIVSGDPGIGKSRLVTEVLQRIEGRSLTLVARCDPHSSSNFYLVAADLIRRAADIEGADDATTRAVLWALLGEQADFVGPHLLAALGMDGELPSPKELTWGTRKVLERLASTRPILIVVEDVHWADADLLSFIEHIHDRGQGPFVLVCTARPELLAERPGWPSKRALSVTLGPLARRDSEQLVVAGAGRPLPEGTVDEIVGLSEGNPLFIEQLLSLMSERVPSADEPMELPKSIEALIAARVERLPPDERDVLSAAAVVGTEFTSQAVRAAVAADHQQFDLLVRKGFIERSSEREADATYRFHHALIEHVTYNLMPKARRVELHQELAQWLEDAATPTLDREELIGHHLERAHQYMSELGQESRRLQNLASRAGSFLGSAGAKALEASDGNRAVDLLSRAADLLPQGGSDRLATMCDLAMSLMDVGRLHDAGDIYAAVVSEAASPNQDAVLWRARLGRLLLDRWIDPVGYDLETSKQVLREAIDALERLDDDRALAEVWRLSAIRSVDIGHLEEAAVAIDRAYDRAMAAGDRAGVPGFRLWRVFAAIRGPTPVKEALSLAQEIHGWVVERSPRTPAEGDALVLLGEVLALDDQIAASRGAFEEADAIYEDFAAGPERAFAAEAIADVEPARSDPVETERVVRPAYDLFSSMGNKGGLSTVAGQLAAALYHQGRLQEALELTLEAERIAGAIDYDAQTRWRRVRAKVAARRGNVEDAENLVAQGVARVEQTDAIRFLADTLVDGAEVFEILGRDRERSTMLKRALDLYREKGDLPSVRATEALLG